MSHTDRVNTWAEFQQRWDSMTNFLLGPGFLPFDYPMPPLDQVVDALRHDEQARIGPGTRGDTLLKQDCASEFRSLALEKAMESPFALAHFRLSRFDAPGKILHGFERRVLQPWKDALAAHGFSFDRCYPIIFISGIRCATNYHMDFSHVLAWQAYGVKRFCGLREPDRWAPREVRVDYKAHEFHRPPELTEDDALCFDMRPGDALWNAILTPHWVEAADNVAMSINLSHGDLRFDGKLSPVEQELVDHRAAMGIETPTGGGRY